MSDDLMSIFSAASPSIPKERIKSLSYGVKKRTGEQFARATLDDGRTFIHTLSKSGVDEQKQIQIPAYHSKEERDSIVLDLLDKYVQDDIADFMDLSQGTVSNIKNRHKKSKKK